MATIADNLHQVRLRIARACADAGRPEQSVTLLAVGKTFAPDALRAEACGPGTAAIVVEPPTAPGASCPSRSKSASAAMSPMLDPIARKPPVQLSLSLCAAS